MKIKRVLVFSIVIASLTFVAMAGGEKEYELKFKGEGAFDMVVDPDWGLVYIPPGGFELLDVSHLGESEVAWKLRVLPPPDGEPFGCFTITAANGKDSLEGIYDGFVLNWEEGWYDLEWEFTGGEGKFDGATGRGHTDGLVDFTTGIAKYEFSGEVKVSE